MSTVEDHSGMGASWLARHPGVPMLHQTGDPCDWCDDQLAPARGCLGGTVLACLLWVGVFGGLALLVARCAR